MFQFYLGLFTLSGLIQFIVRTVLYNRYKHILDEKKLLAFANHDNWLAFKESKTDFKRSVQGGKKLVEYIKSCTGVPLIDLLKDD